MDAFNEGMALINKAIKKEQDKRKQYMTEEQLIERERVSSVPVTKDSTILWNTALVRLQNQKK